MRYIKLPGLLAMAAAALLAFVGTASADTFTSSPGTAYIGLIKATSTNATLHNAIGTISCHSTVEGNITGYGAKSNVTGSITHLTFTSCEGGEVHNSTIKGGTLSLDVTETKEKARGTGILYSSGATVMVTMGGFECGYTTEGTTIGTVTGGEHAAFVISASLKRTEGKSGFFCGSTGNWTGSYQVTSPTNVHLDNN